MNGIINHPEVVMTSQATELATHAVSRNPANGELIKTYPFQSSDEVENTLAANAIAARQWRNTSMAERVKSYGRLAVTLRERSESLAMLATSEMGKTLK